MVEKVTHFSKDFPNKCSNFSELLLTGKALHHSSLTEKLEIDSHIMKHFTIDQHIS